MKFKTSITNIEDDMEIIRGHELSSLMKDKSFSEAIFLLLKGELPNEFEKKMVDAILVSAIDHGPGTASAQTARIAVSAGNSLHTGVAAGILGMGTRHGLAIEGAAKFFQENLNNSDIETLIKDMKEKGERVPGYGHPVLDHDKRVDVLFAVAKDLGIFGKHSEMSEKVLELLNLISSKKLPLNIDGAMAAVLSDMGFEWKLMGGFFVIARVPGLVAQVYEEITGDAGLRRLGEDEIEYVGK